MTGTGTLTNRRTWLIAVAAAVPVFALGFAAGNATARPARPPRTTYLALGGYQTHQLVIDDGTANLYYVGPTTIQYVGNMRDAQRPPNWPPVPAEAPR